MKNLIFIMFTFLFLFSAVEAKTANINIDFFKKFNDEYLLKYIFQTLECNHELKQASARVERYKYETKKALSKEFPELSVNGSYLGAHFPGGDDNIFVKRNSFILPFFVNWELDLLLKNKDEIKSKDYIYKANLAYQKGVYLSLLSNTASSYINILLYDYLIKKQKEILSNYEKNFELENKKFNYGIIDVITLNNQKEHLKNEKEYLNSLIKNKNTMIYQLTSLMGQSAYDSEEIKRGTFEKLEYIENIPDIINSDLIYSRPDIIEAENRLKSAKLDITKAKKDFFPRFNIMALLAFDTVGVGNFFNWNSSFAFLIASAAQDLFSGGRKIAELNIRKAKFKELFENYKQLDINAIKETANALNIIKNDTKLEQISKEKLTIEEKNLKLAQHKLKHGLISESDFLNSQIKFNQKEQNCANLKTARLIDYITLYKALGGEL